MLNRPLRCPRHISGHYISPALIFLWPLHFSGPYISLATIFLWPLHFSDHYISVLPHSRAPIELSNFELNSIRQNEAIYKSNISNCTLHCQNAGGTAGAVPPVFNRTSPQALPEALLGVSPLQKFSNSISFRLSGCLIRLADHVLSHMHKTRIESNRIEHPPYSSRIEL
jgi:hypothetical protein